VFAPGDNSFTADAFEDGSTKIPTPPDNDQVPVPIWGNMAASVVLSEHID
jgi:hypothetical protein